MSRASGRVAALLLLALVGACTPDERAAPTAPVAGMRSVANPPNPPVLFLHYDYMVQDTADQFSPAHSDAPHPESIDSLVTAFRRHGIQVVIDPKHSVLPHERVTIICDGGVLPAFRARYFAPHGNRPWHYVVFGHFVQVCDDGGASGFAELPGFNFIVAVGFQFHEPGALFSRCGDDFHSYDDRCVRMEAGTLLHELGHNLDLYHGGDQDEPFNFKPNYLSVMNYEFQTGIPYSATSGSTNVAGYRLDYSDRALPNIDETHVDERMGLGGTPGSRDLSFYSSYECLDPGDLATCGFAGAQTVSVTGAIDWNRNGVLEPDIAYDVSYLRRLTSTNPVPQFYPVLTGFDDWAHINEFLRTPAYVSGTLRRRGTLR